LFTVNYDVSSNVLTARAMFSMLLFFNILVIYIVTVICKLLLHVPKLDQCTSCVSLLPPGE